MVRRNLATNPSAEVSTSGWVGQAATVTTDASWSAVGSRSFRVTPSGGSISCDMRAGSPAAFPFGMVPGKSYTVTATGRLSAPQIGTLDSRARGVSLLYSTNGTSYITSQGTQGPNVAGEFVSTVTVDIPSNATGALIMLGAGSNNPADVIWWDAVLICEEGGTYFDGDSEWTSTHRYRWEGAPNASVSVEETIPQRITVDPVYGAGAPAAELTIAELGFTDSLVSLWRTADGERVEVRGYRRVRMIDTARILDVDVPYERPVTYEVEVISGPDGPSRTTSAPIIVESPTAWIMNPLDPSTAVPVVGEHTQDGAPYFRGKALSELEYAANVSLIDIMGSNVPMGLFGQVMKERGVPLSMGTRSASQNAKLKRLLTSSAQLLFKPIPAFGVALPGTMHISVATKSELPVTVAMGGDLTWWELTADTVAAPTIKVLTATFTYGDVKVLFATYQQKADALAPGATYLDDSKAPFG